MTDQPTDAPNADAAMDAFTAASINTNLLIERLSEVEDVLRAGAPNKAAMEQMIAHTQAAAINNLAGALLAGVSELRELRLLLEADAAQYRVPGSVD